MTRTLLLCFIHGFKGTDDTFHDFPSDLKRAVKKRLPNDRVEIVVYPKYETKGELAEATAAFLEWLKERVMDIRKEHSETPWPPNDRDVGVVLVAHSMGGFVAADSLFLALNERKPNDQGGSPRIFPAIQGILTFDTPYNGLARSMFVYGAFSNYTKVSTVFNVMTALSAAAPAGLARLGTRTAASASVPPGASTSRNPQWRAWQLVAVKTGTVGAIAAGGVAAYMNREAILSSMRSVKNLNRESVAEGYRQGMESLGQGLAYINRGNVGKSFAWMSDHFTFVGALLKQNELALRLQRMGRLKGVGVHDYYVSLGENGYWSGGYFVPERTFCAVPDADQEASHIFSRFVMPKVDDEMKAHLSMFKPERNGSYDHMTEKSASLVEEWFLADEEIVDDPSIQEANVEGQQAEAAAAEILEKEPEKVEKLGEQLPDESPIDIAAAASLVPLPEQDEAEKKGEGYDVHDEHAEEAEADTPEKRHYLNHLFRVAQQAGAGVSDVRGWLPASIPTPSMPSLPQMPQMPQMPAAVSSLGQISLPSVPSILSKKKPEAEKGDQSEEKGKDGEGKDIKEKGKGGDGKDAKEKGE